MNELQILIKKALNAGINRPDFMGLVEREYLIAVLADSSGNQCLAASRLHVHRNTMGRLLGIHNIDPKKYRKSAR